MTAAAPLPTIGAARYAGSRVQRVEDARLLTGAGTFVDDVVRPGMLHACFVRSPHPRARILRHRLPSAALALPGVHAVFTAADLNGDVRAAWYSGHGRARARHAAAAAAPTVRPGSPATSSRWSSPTAGTSRRTAPTWSPSTTSRCPRWRTTRCRRASGDAAASTRPTRGTSRAQMGGAPAETHRGRPRRRGARGDRDDQAAGVRRRADGDPRPRRGVVGGRADRLGRPPRRRTRCGCSAHGCSACPSTGSG